MSEPRSDRDTPATPLDALGILASQQAMMNPGLRHVEMYTRRGLLSILWHEPTGETRPWATVMLGGAMGGVLGPGDSLYHVLGEELAERGIPTIRVSYRAPNDLDSCCVDAAAAVQLAVGSGADHVVLMGHSFGGAVAVRVGVGLSEMVAGIVTFATQSAGCEVAGGLQGKPLLMFHGDSDSILPADASEVVRAIAGSGDLRIMEGDDHLLSKSHERMRREVLEWVDSLVAGAVQ